MLGDSVNVALYEEEEIQHGIFYRLPWCCHGVVTRRNQHSIEIRIEDLNRITSQIFRPQFFNF